MPKGTTVTCPHCGVANDGHTDPKDPTARPSDGALSMCLYCGGMAVYTDNATDLRFPSEVEQAEIDADPWVQRMLATRTQVMDER